jgi:parvulin-like peptidyl-prolyl isomerase
METYQHVPNAVGKGGKHHDESNSLLVDIEEHYVQEMHQQHLRRETLKEQQKRRGLIVEQDPRATVEVGNTHGQGIEENSEEKESLRLQMQADDGFEFEDSN